MDASPLADRVAARAVQGEYSPDDAIVLGCVGALSAADAFLPGGLHYAEGDAASLLVLTAGALWARGAPFADTPGATRALADLARRTLDVHGTRVLSVTESLLAPVDPEGTWALIEHVVGGPAAVDSALGLDVAAHLELDRGELWRPPLPCPAPFTAQLVTDRIARAVIAGRPLPDGSRSPEELLEGELRATSPARAQVLLVAAAAALPARALSLVDHVLQRLAPADLGDALRLVAILLAHAGLADEVSAAVRRRTFVAEQCVWVAAGAAARVIRPDEVVTLASDLSARVDDELDHGREWVAGLPLVEALLTLGAVDVALPLVDRWQLPARAIVSRCLHTGSAAAAGALARHPGLGILLGKRHATGTGKYPPWWATGAEDQAGQLAALRDVLTVVEQAPWAAPPGSLADLLGLTRRPLS